jgi:hypothetical protein
MKKLKLFLLLFLIPAFLKAGIYDGVIIDTGTKTAERNLSGLLGVAETADTPSTYRITVDGSDGSVNSEILKSPILRGGIDASDNLTLQSTSNATKGKIFFGTNSVFDEVNNRLGIGETSPTNTVEFVDSLGILKYFEGLSSTVRLDGGGVMQNLRYNTSFTSPTTILNGDVLGLFRFGGHDGNSEITNSIVLRGVATEDWTTTAHGSEFQFRVTTNGSPAGTLKMVVSNEGNVGIGVSAPQSKLEVEGFYSYSSPTELTIAGGVVTAVRSYHTIDTQNNDATDDLDTINGGSVGRILIITSANSDRDTTLKHATGNLRLSQGNDFTLDNINATMQLLYDGSNWIEISRSANI